MSNMAGDFFVRTLKNGLAIKGFFAHNQHGKTASFKIELFVSHANAPRLWSQILTHSQFTDSSKALFHEIKKLEADLIEHCVDQVPATPKGFMLMEALLGNMGRDRRAKQKAL